MADATLGFDATTAQATPPPKFDHTSAKPVPFDASTARDENTTPGSTHTYSFDELKGLWTKYGGAPDVADQMAHAAMAESSGRPWASNQYTEKGKQYHVKGLWQISDIHGAANYEDPVVNVKKAIELYNAQKMGPWEASRDGPNGWGQYVGNHLEQLPAGGFAKVIGAHYVPTLAGESGAIKMIADRATALFQIINSSAEHLTDQLAPVSRQAGAATAASPVGQAVASKLAPAVTRIADVADAFTFAPLNALMRTAAGDNEHGLAQYWNMTKPDVPPMTPGDVMKRALLGPFGGGPDMTMPLHNITQEFGFNAPADINYWTSQPGLRAKLLDANPATARFSPAMALMQLALGMHADIARLKPNHPYLSGVETGVAQYFNPAYMAMGEVGGATLREILGGLKAARMAPEMAITADMSPAMRVTRKLSNLARGAARGAADSPVIGNRFWRMGDTFGPWGEEMHRTLTRSQHNIPYVAQDLATSEDTFGGSTREEQLAIVDAREHPNEPSYQGGRTKTGLIVDKALNVGETIDATANRLRELDPEMAKRLLDGDVFDYYFPHVGGTWDLPENADPMYAAGQTRRDVGGASSGVVSQGRVYNSLQDGYAKGAQLNKDWMPSGSMAMQQTKMLRYINLVEWLNGLEGHGARMPIEYRWPMIGKDGLPSGLKRIVGTGRSGYDAAESIAKGYGQDRAQAEAAEQGRYRNWSPQEIAAHAANRVDHYTNNAWRIMRKEFRDKHPGFDFDAADTLGVDILKGHAVHGDAVEAVFDSHPSFAKAPRNVDPQTGELVRNYTLHKQIESPANFGSATWDNVNSVVRQGILSNVGWHPAFNLLPMALNAGVSPILLARALFGGKIPEGWMELAAHYQASAPKFGVGINVHPMTRAKLLTVPYGGLSPGEILQKAFIQGSKWNQDVTFGYFEDRIAAVTMKHYMDRGMNKPQAAIATRKLLGDYENLTPLERAASLRNWHYFYAWMRSQLRYWGNELVTKPQSIMAPLQGVQTANQQQGDAGSVGGGALSLRAAGNAVGSMVDRLTGQPQGTRQWGTDADGNPQQLSLPTPVFRYGSDVARLAGGTMSGDPDEMLDVSTKLATGSMPPLAGLAARLVATHYLPAGIPEPYDARLWDKNAPNNATKWGQFGAKFGEMYLPSVARAPVEAITQHNPASLLGTLGPSVYSAPNPSQQTKRNYGILMDLRAVLKDAETENNSDVSGEVYSLMEGVQSGDPVAIAQARRRLTSIRRELGIRTRHRTRLF